MEPVRDRHPLIDRTGVASELEEKLGPQLDLVDELVDYGVRLLMRTFSTAKRDATDVVVLPVVLRQVIAMLDSVSIHLRNGALYAAEVPLRAIMEASWTLEWMLREDKEREARSYFVAHLRRNLRAARRYEPGTEEHDRLRQLTEREFPGALPVEERQDEFRRVAEACTDLLRDPKYAELNAAFDRHIKRRGQRHEPNWFAPALDGEDRPNSIRQLAERLNRLAEYDLIYAAFSGATHGYGLTSHVQFEEGRLGIEPIRSPQGFKTVVMLSVSASLRSFELVLRNYRPDELQVFRRDYVEKWRERYIGMPEIVVDQHEVEF